MEGVVIFEGLLLHRVIGVVVDGGSEWRRREG